MTQPPGGPEQQPYSAQGMPPAPPLNDAEAARPPRPKAVDSSVLLWLVAAGISLIANLVSLATADAVAEHVSQQLGVSMESAEPGVAGTVFQVALLVAWVATVFAMRRGQNWARILLTVLGGLFLLISLIGLLGLGVLFAVGGLAIVQGLLSVVSIAVVIAAIVFQFRRESNHYFARS